MLKNSGKTGCTVTMLFTFIILVCMGCENKALTLARQPLPENDGWASVRGGTTGGSNALDINVFTASNRAELVEALQANGHPEAAKIILVKGTINVCVDDDNNELFEKDFADPGYNFKDYVEAYKPSTWNVKLETNGRPLRKLTGPLEEARKKSADKQKKRVLINITSNTSLIGIEKDARIIKGNLRIGDGIENVIVRNITFEDSFDYFPAWDPGDSYKIRAEYPGAQAEYVDENTGPQKAPGGRWNAEYDLISINGGQNVWIDHCTFSDGDRPDYLFPPVYPFPHNQVEQKVQHHDGLVDITNAADYITISYCVFKDHDKTCLIGSSNSSKIDHGKLNVTFHHNLFTNTGQRLPRVRFGKVHSYNNYFIGNALGAPDPRLNALENHLKAIELSPQHHILRGAFGIGKESKIYSENNYFEIENGGPDFAAVVQSGGTAFFDQGSLVNGEKADIVAAINAIDIKKQLSRDVGWKPELYGEAPFLDAADVREYVKKHAGAGNY